MIPYDNTNVVPWFNGLSATDINTWASDCVSNWLNAWTSRFILTSNDIAALSKVPLLVQQSFINGLKQYAIEKGAGRSVDISGLNVSGGGHWTLHLNIIDTGGLFPIVSVWWTHTP